jgi:hypothetical protein
MAKKNSSKFWILVVLLTIGLWILREAISFLNRYLGFLNELFIFCLCVMSAMYLADRFK